MGELQGLRALGAPAGGEVPLADLGELGATVGGQGVVQGFMDQALPDYEAFVGRLVGSG